jgi:hypothetical protein
MEYEWRGAPIRLHEPSNETGDRVHGRSATLLMIPTWQVWAFDKFYTCDATNSTLFHKTHPEPRQQPHL